jgi:hypothetical protein
VNWDAKEPALMGNFGMAPVELKPEDHGKPARRHL